VGRKNLGPKKPSLAVARDGGYHCVPIIILEARAISGQRLRLGFSQSNSERHSQRRATRHAVYQVSQNPFHTPL